MLCADLPCPPLADSAYVTTLSEVVVHGARMTPFRGDRVFGTVDLSAAALQDAPTLDQSLKLHAQATLFRRSSSAIANPTIQGMSLRSIGPSGAGRALVSLNGVPQGDPFGGWVIWAGLPQEAVGSAHIVRGAGGGAYGAGALTGVVDLNLASPSQDQAYGKASLTQSSARQLSAGGQFGGLGVHYQHSVLQGDVPVRGARSGAADVATAGRDQAVLLTGQTTLCPWDQCAEAFAVGGHYTSQRDTGVLAATAKASGEHLSLGLVRQPTAAQAGYKIQLWHRGSDLANRSVAITPDRQRTSISNDQFATPAQAQGGMWAWRLQSAELEWEVGIDARKNQGESQELNGFVSGKPSRLRVAGGETLLWGLYTEASHVQGAWTLTGSARLDQWQMRNGFRRVTDANTGALQSDLHLPSRKGQTATGRMGVAWAPKPQTTWRLAAYQGFRLPTLNELYRPFRVGNDITESNAALNAEKLSGLEIGFRQDFRQGSQQDRQQDQSAAFVDIGLFLNVLRDPITNVTIGVGPGTFPLVGRLPAGATLRQRQNLGEVRASGIEVQAQYPLSPALALTGSATLTQARIARADTNPALNDKRPAQAPQTLASAGLQYQYRPWTLAAQLMLEGGSFENDLNTLRLGGYHTLDLRAAYQLSPGVQLQAQMLNALDREVQISRSADGIVAYDNRRRLWLGLTARF